MTPTPSPPSTTLNNRLSSRLASPLFRLAGLATLFIGWLLLSEAVGSRTIPGPVTTFEFIVREFNRGAMQEHLAATFSRVLISFAISMLLGVVTGTLMGLYRRVDELLEAWVVAGLSIPRLVLFVSAYLTMGLNDRAAIVALTISVLPTVIVQVREGTRAIDRKLVEMAEAFRRSRLQIARRVILPQLMPYIVGTARTTLALAWKMVVLAELMGRTSGVGYQISFYYQMFNMPGILAYGITMMIILAILNIISLSETDARSLGVNLARIRRILIVAATLITAAAVSAAGIIAWIATGCEAEAGFTAAPAS